MAMGTWKITVIVLAGLAGLGLAGCGATDAGSAGKVTSGSTAAAAASSSPSGIAHAEDVKITACGNIGAAGGPAATAVITNHSSKPSNYLVTIAFESADGKTQYGTGTITVQDLNPGQSSSPQTADSLNTSAAPSGFTCAISQLDRFAA